MSSFSLIGVDPELFSKASQRAKEELSKGGIYLIGSGADLFSYGQDKSAKYLIKGGSVTLFKINEGLTKILTGCHDKDHYQFYSSLGLIGITAYCGYKAFKNLGFSWHYLPIPGFRSKKIVTITHVNLPGHDVKIDDVKEEERGIEKVGTHMKEALFYASVAAVAGLGVVIQIKNAREQCARPNFVQI